ncbi:WD40 repeat protein [Solirubrobacter pauli]|uniref:WD40 repeat protein n=1 Tax=Solirubrobacter pauli TaxID=166793 RepID=A0A660L7V4_9ACTN|nr:PD40 domain-containing protein [Solirubrobacter pauli]RKQ90335.1 WD40 repeat protein [Solirubrobacter pauli]
MKRLILPALLLAALPGSAHAATGSLAYVKDGDVHVSAPDGGHATRITTDGGYAWPSQADDGTLVAVRQTAENGRTPRRLHRFHRDGTRIGAPLETVKVDNRNFVGPLQPQVSPDGTKIAYHFFNTGVLSDRERTTVAYTSVEQGSEPGVFADALGGYLTPSWTADGRVLVFYGAQRTSHVGIDTVGAGYQDWFGDPAVTTLLTDGELTRAGDKLVAVGDQNDLRFYDAGAQLRCVLTGFNGNVNDPTWAPDGSALAWEEADGIHVAQLGDISACASAARPLVLPGATDPDWGPAAAPVPPTEPSGPVQTAPATLRVDLSGWRGSVRRGPSVRARCSSACALTARLTLTAKTARRHKLPRTLARTTAHKAGTLKFRVSRKARGVTATLTVVATSGDQRVTSVRRVRLTR